MLNVKNLDVIQFLKKYTTKSECTTDHHLQRNIFERLVIHLDSQQLAPTNSKMNHVANQPIFKTINFQKFSIGPKI